MTKISNVYLKSLLLVGLLWLLSTANRLHAQGCSPDVTPPTAVCNELVYLSLSTDGTLEVDADAFNDGSYDNCCMGDITLRRTTDGPCDSDNNPDAFTPTLIFCCADIGTQVIVEMRVSDCAGNTNICLTTVIVEDKVAPVCPAASVTVSCEQFDPTLLNYGPTDNCCLEEVVPLTTNYTLFDTLCLEGVISRTFRAEDCSGNTVTCFQTIEVTYEQDYYIRFPNDAVVWNIDPNTVLPQPEIFKEDCELIGLSFEDEIFFDQPNGNYTVHRTWTIINWCTYDPNLPVTVVPNPAPNADPNHPANLVGPMVSEAGTPAPWEPTVVKINANDPDPTDYSTFWAANANGYRYTQYIKVVDTFFVDVEGKVFSDTSANCSYEAGEELLEGWTVKVTGGVSGSVREVLTAADGSYYVRFDGYDTVLTVTLVASSNFGQNCQTEYTVNAAVGETAVQDVPVHLEERCELLSVGIATPRLRRCFDNRYAVQACNLSSEIVEDAYVEVALDDYFNFTGSSIPGTLTSGNTYSFQLGDLAPGACVNFNIDFVVSCDAPIGATHCTEAWIFPTDDCRDNTSWTGADVEVDAICEGDSVRFSIANVGTGNMSEVLEFVVVEDVIMRQDGSFQLGMGESITFTQPANGSTWRLEADEEPQHPWGGKQAVALEGCGGINNSGLVNIFPLSDPNPFESIECLVNIGAYDPNDKQGFPIGYGDEHFIKANTDIEYLIRFQNTGTDTAFNVVILDTLAQHLDAASVRVGVASHPMKFALLDGNVLRFSFEDILLPDSNVNQAGSNGFVKFRISQQRDLANGTRIENSAAIYFDFNEPVITNTTFHTVGEDFVLVGIDAVENDGLLRAYPNPATDQVFFELKEGAVQGRFVLSNTLGQTLASESFEGKQYRFNRKNLPAGIYHFQISAANQRVAAGKLILR